MSSGIIHCMIVFPTHKALAVLWRSEEELRVCLRNPTPRWTCNRSCQRWGTSELGLLFLRCSHALKLKYLENDTKWVEVLQGQACGVRKWIICPWKKILRSAEKGKNGRGSNFFVSNTDHFRRHRAGKWLRHYCWTPRHPSQPDHPTLCLTLCSPQVWEWILQSIVCCADQSSREPKHQNRDGYFGHSM